VSTVPVSAIADAPANVVAPMVNTSRERPVAASRETPVPVRNTLLLVPAYVISVRSGRFGGF
jgi:hypothetical protein